VLVFLEILRVVVRKGETIASQLDGRGHHLFNRQLAVLLLRIDQSRHRARNADRFVSDHA
jgi:hypothetical protein